MHLLATRYPFEPGFHQRRGPYVLAYMKQICRKTGGWGGRKVLIKNKQKTLVTGTCVWMASRSVHTGSLYSMYIVHHTPAWAGTEFRDGDDIS